jgi:AcrR family transcriptional regulator
MKAAPRHPPDTRERILDAAERLFAECGFAGTSIRDITEAAAVNLSAVNYHFQSKENLYAEVFARRVALLREPMAKVAKQVGPIARRRPNEALRAFGRVFLAPHERRDTLLRLLFAREMIEERLPSGYLKRLRRPTTDALTDLVRRSCSRWRSCQTPGACRTCWVSP